MAGDRDIAFPQLSEAELRALAPWGTERATTAGELLFAEGERRFGVLVVLAGSIEILENSTGAERLVTVHQVGDFTGDVDALSGRVSLVAGRVKEGGRVLVIDPDRLRTLIDELPEIGETMLKAFLVRRTLLLGTGFGGMKIVGSRFDARAHRLRDFATRNAVPFTWIDLERDAQSDALLRQFAIAPAQLPAVICTSGHWLSNPTLPELARGLGIDAPLDHGLVHDLIVVGAGPAGLAASVYAASEGLDVLTLDAEAVGGQAGTSARIENYLGFASGVSGAELTRQALLQAQKFGARISVPREVKRLRLDGGVRVVVLDDGSEVRARCVLVASGVDYRRLDLPNLRDFEGAGVYYAATDMEARLCRGDDVVVVGGGNSAGQAVVFLSRYARRVHLVIRGESLDKSMSRYLVDRVQGIDNVTIHRACKVTLLEGAGHIERVCISPIGGGELTIGTSAVFLFIGAAPRTGWLRDCVQLDRHGFVLTGEALAPETAASDRWLALGRPPLPLETSLPGIFAAGDVRSGSMKRVASAVGEGAMAVSFVHAHFAAPSMVREIGAASRSANAASETSAAM